MSEQLIHNSMDDSERPMSYYKFEFHTDEAGVRQRVAETPTLSFIEVGGEAPAEVIRDEEPAKVEEPEAPLPQEPKKSEGFFRNNKDTQKGVN